MRGGAGAPKSESLDKASTVDNFAASSVADVDYASAFVEQNRAFAELIRNADGSKPVPSCPGWSLTQLIRHVGRGDRWAAQIVRDKLDDFLDPRGVEGGKPPPDPDDVFSWLQGGAQRLVDAVEQSGVETPVWTFLGTRPANWWVRRRLHEVAVHRADAALALESDFTLEPEVAADGIGEWLDRIAVQAGSDGSALPLEEGHRGAARRRHRAAAGDGAPSRGHRHRYRDVRRRRRMAKMAGPHTSLILV